MDDKGIRKSGEKWICGTVLAAFLMLLICEMCMSSYSCRILAAMIECIIICFYNSTCSREILEWGIKGAVIYQSGSALYEIVFRGQEGLWKCVESADAIGFFNIGGVILLTAIGFMLFIYMLQGLGNDALRQLLFIQFIYVCVAVVGGGVCFIWYEEKIRKYLIVLPICIFIFYVVYVLGIQTENTADDFQEKKVLDELTVELKDSFAQRELCYERVRKAVHDIKNQLFGLKYYLLMEEYSQSREYLDTILNQLKVCGTGLDGGTEPWELLIDSKARQAREKGIDFRVKVSADKCVGIDTVDLCIILGNLLDNAIEALDGREMQKNITCEMKERCHLLAIRISNPVADGMMEKAMRLESEKKESVLHV